MTEEQLAAKRERKRASNARNYAKHKDQRCARKREWRNADPIGYMLYYAKQRAKKQGLPFTITAADLPSPLPTHCPALGIELAYGVEVGDPKWESGRPNAASLDRINSAKGYEPGNVCILSWRANSIKKDATLVELQQIVAYLSKVVVAG